MQPDALTTRVCIAGGGPAGMMLAVLLARAGIDVALLEKYPDFFRDFRGDTIHPSTLQLLYELGWLDEFLTLPHDEMREVGANIAGERVAVADFTHLPTRCKFIAFMPQWDFLNFLASRGRRYPTFHLMMETQCTDLIEGAGRITGVRARTKDGEIAIGADLVVGADGRHSTVRDLAGFTVENMGAPMDVIWTRISQRPGDPRQPLGTLGRNTILVMIDRTTYWQCAFLIPKGSFEQLKSSGIETLQRAIAATVPALENRVAEIDDWSKVSLLSVRVDRLTRWHRPGLLCIGDAAHAMSPIGGVGINLAIQDAVAAANALAEPMRAGAVSDALLAYVQRRRTFPTKVLQGIQVFIAERAIEPILAGATVTRVPLPVRLLNRFPLLRRLPARLLGLGPRPEHVRTADAYAQPAAQRA